MVTPNIGSSTIGLNLPFAVANGSAAPASGITAGSGGSASHHNSGRLLQALQETFQSLGLSPTAIVNPATAAGSADASASGTSLETAVRNFVHAVFSAVQTESSSTSTASSAAGAGGRFSVGLSSLITQVSNGNAPSDLQSAYDTLSADLEENSAAGATVSVNLQSLLTTLQQNLGYDHTDTNVAAAGSVDAQA